MQMGLQVRIVKEFVLASEGVIMFGDTRKYPKGGSTILSLSDEEEFHGNDDGDPDEVGVDQLSESGWRVSPASAAE